MATARSVLQSSFVFMRTRPPKMFRPSLWGLQFADFSFLDDSQTLKYLTSHDVGWVRLGNSELAYIAGRDIRHQRQDSRLRRLLRSIVEEYNMQGSPEEAGFLLCLPLDLTVGKDSFERSVHSFSKKPYRADIWQRSPRYVTDLLAKKHVLYGSSNAMRFRESVTADGLQKHIDDYLTFLNSSRSIFFAPATDHARIQKHLHDVKIVEIPPTNSFSRFDDIVREAMSFSVSHPSSRVLVTAGLTGTALSAGLNRSGVRALDVGQSLRHIDAVQHADS